MKSFKIILDYSFRTLEPTASVDEQIDAIMPEQTGEELPEEDVTTVEENSSESEEG